MCYTKRFTRKLKTFLYQCFNYRLSVNWRTVSPPLAFGLIGKFIHSLSVHEITALPFDHGAHRAAFQTLPHSSGMTRSQISPMASMCVSNIGAPFRGIEHLDEVPCERVNQDMPDTTLSIR